jgi:superfamily I DNA/RNA helicase
VIVLDASGGEQRLPHAVLDSVRTRIQALGQPHNEARRNYRRALARAARVHQLDDENPHADQIQTSLDRAVDRLWPERTPAQVLQALFSNPRLLEVAGGRLLSASEQGLLHRPAEQPFTTSDLPLLDELRVILGTPPKRTTERTEEEVTIHQMAKDTINEIAAALDEGGQIVRDLLTPEMLVARHHGDAPQHSLAEMARRDPSWQYSHVVVDEAQDATPMQWRAIWRRTTGGSMTIVGDPDQASRPTDDTLVERIISGAPKAAIDHHTLDVNYRTPAGIVEPAQRLRGLRTGLPDPTSTRYVRTGAAPWTTTVESIDAASVRTAVARALDDLGQIGRLAVVAPRRHAELVRAEVAALTDSETRRGAARLDTQVAVYLPTEVKGLEFDSVVVIDPALIEADHGWRQLYVTLTRPTRHLGLLLVGDAASPWAG